MDDFTRQRDLVSTINTVRALGFHALFADEFNSLRADIEGKLEREMTEQELLRLRERFLARKKADFPEAARQARELIQGAIKRGKAKSSPSAAQDAQESPSAAQDAQESTSAAQDMRSGRSAASRWAVLLVLLLGGLMLVWSLYGCGCPAGMVRTGYPGMGPKGESLPSGRCVVPE